MASELKPIEIAYTNYRGETSLRTITPQRVWFGSTEWHPEPQWLVTAYDHDKQAVRDFAFKDFNTRPAPAATDTGLVRLSLVRGGGLEPNQNGDYIRFSQAEELLAAERAEKEAFAEEIKEAAYEAWPEANDVGSDAPQIIRQLGQERDKLEAELAATRAENARLMKINKAHCQTVNTLTIDGAQLDTKVEALEAKLAAAEKVAQLVVQAEEDKSGDPNFYILLMQTAYDKARAVLGGKPS